MVLVKQSKIYAGFVLRSMQLMISVVYVIFVKLLCCQIIASRRYICTPANASPVGDLRGVDWLYHHNVLPAYWTLLAHSFNDVGTSQTACKVATWNDDTVDWLVHANLASPCVRFAAALGGSSVCSSAIFFVRDPFACTLHTELNKALQAGPHVFQRCSPLAIFRTVLKNFIEEMVLVFAHGHDSAVSLE